VFSETTRAGRVPACSWPSVGFKFTRQTSPRDGWLRLFIYSVSGRPIPDLPLLKFLLPRGWIGLETRILLIGRLEEPLTSVMLEGALEHGLHRHMLVICEFTQSAVGGFTDTDIAGRHNTLSYTVQSTFQSTQLYTTKVATRANI